MGIYTFICGVMVLATAILIVSMVLKNRITLETMRQEEAQRQRLYYVNTPVEPVVPDDEPTKIVEEKKEEIPPTVFAYLDEFFEEG